MPLLLARPTPADVEALFAFERDNRAFFEATINARPASYYSIDGVAQAVTRAMQDAADDLGYQYMVNSARILLRNGFVQFGQSRRSFELHGVRYDRLHFECHAT
jgi:hypothetical protein